MPRFVVKYEGEGAETAENWEAERFLFDDYIGYLVDTTTNQIVAADGGEPEDMTFGRNLSQLVWLLNEVADGR